MPAVGTPVQFFFDKADLSSPNPGLVQREVSDASCRIVAWADVGFVDKVCSHVSVASPGEPCYRLVTEA